MLAFESLDKEKFKMKLHALALLCFGFLFCMVSATDPIAKTFLSLLKEAALETIPSSKDDFGVINKIKNLDLDQVSDRKSITKSWELEHQLSGPRPEVLIKNGRVIGETVSNSHAFYSVPYGKPPVGLLRFMPPEPAEDFLQLNASLPNYRMCWQIKDCGDDEPNCRDPMSEDCLVLNINVPSTVDLSDASAPPSERLPVLVWFHGGFFFRGRATTTKYDGRWLSSAINAIVVTVNYRLGPLGFLTFEDDLGYVEGNQGLKDQQLALRWVQENIEAFGGDKDRVTLFGNSAGSQAVYFHLVSGVSDPLFNRAIIQSAPAAIRYQTAQEAMNSVTPKVEESLCGVSNFTCNWTLRTASAEALTYSRNSVMAKLLAEKDWFGAIEPFRPVVDGSEIVDQPLKLFESGKWQNHKELIIGINQEEMAAISAFFENIGLPLPKAIFETLNTFVFGKENGEKVNAMYEKNFDFDLSDNLAEELTDMVFLCPNRAFARHSARTSTHPSKRVYFYNHAYSLSNENCLLIEDDLPTLCGNSYHSSEQMFVLKSFEGYETGFTAEDILVSDMISTYWGGFANAGDPSSGLTTSLGDFTPWPIYEDLSSPAWINIQLDYPNSALQAGLKEKHCDLWEEIGYATP